MPSANAVWYRVGEALLVLSSGDITSWSGDAIVNAANERMLGGGGVDGAIHRAAGPKLLEACQQVPEVQPGVRCPTGQARITRAGRLQVKYVIHAVGPVYENAEVSAPLLGGAYTACLDLANKHKLENIGLPAISTGVYGYPKDEAAQVALSAVKAAVGGVKYIEFVLFQQEVFDAFKLAADQLLEAMPSMATTNDDPPPAPSTSQGGRTASLHPSSQAAQPTDSGSQSDSVCGGTKAGPAADEVTSLQAARAPTPSGTAGGAPSHTPSGAAGGGLSAGAAPSAQRSFLTAPSHVTAPSSAVCGSVVAGSAVGAPVSTCKQ